MNSCGTSALTRLVARNHAAALRLLLLHTCLPLALSLLVVPATEAQSPYLPSRSDVTIDYSVLDSLGPPPTVPGLLLHRPHAPLMLHPSAHHSIHATERARFHTHSYAHARTHHLAHPRALAQAQSHRHVATNKPRHHTSRIASAAPIKLTPPKRHEAAPIATAEARPTPAPLKLRPPTPGHKDPVALADARPPEAPLKLTRPAPKTSTPAAATESALPPAVAAVIESPPDKAPAVKPTLTVAMAAPKAAAPAIVARPTQVAPAKPVPASPVPPQTASLAAVSVPTSPPSSAAVAIPVVAPAGLPGRTSVVRFDAGVSEIPPDEKALLDSVAGRLLGTDGLRLQLVAYASGSGDDPIEARRISLARAVAVRAYLIDKGIHSFRMDVRALGNRSDGGGPADRVDLIILDH